MSDKKKVAVLGGGAGALSAALALTDPTRGDRYEVTVYTLGWRLGGKGASGRNPDFGQRIEEHGIHVWFGFYDNAFRLLDGCYQELAKAGWQTPARRPVRIDHCVARAPDDSRAAFHPHESFVVNEQLKDEAWSKWRLDVPRNERVPGDGKPVLPEESLALAKLAEMLRSVTDVRAEAQRERLESLPAEAPAPPLDTQEEKDFYRYVEDRVQQYYEGRVVPTPEDFLQHALDGLAAPALDQSLSTSLEGLLDGDTAFRLRLRFVAWTLRCARTLVKPWGSLSEKAHRLYLACDTFAAIATGLSRDVFEKGGDVERNMDALDDFELRAWLGKHGADPDYLLSNPTVRFIYNSAFAFVDGNHLAPSIAAGSALRGVLRLFLTYKGAFAYRMAAGMGDVVFSPIYEALRRRGVRFKFFHRVDGLELAEADGRTVVDQIRVAEQVPLAGASYDPFVWVSDFPCWPNRPRFEQLADGVRLEKAVREDGLNLEDPAARWDGEAPHVLQRGEDFDQVVLGIPVEALKPIARSLCDHPTIGPAWKAMFANAATTPTQAFQIWSRASLKELGWDQPAPVFGTYVEPIDTYIDMTPALVLEEQRADAVNGLSYFCGVFERQVGETHAQATRRALDNAVEHLIRRCWYIWNAVRTGADFEWTLLWGGKKGLPARENFEAGQFARANVLPSELYTLNLPRSLQHRLRPDAAADPNGGVPGNLWLAGDWTRNPINLGCVEATVMTGLCAARGLSRADGPAHAAGPTDIEIVGEHDGYLWQSIGRGSRTLSSYESVRPQARIAPEAAEAGAWTDESSTLLEQAVARFDRATVAAMCAKLVEQLQEQAPPISEGVAREVLSALRRKQYFDLIQQVADAFIQAGIDGPQIRRQYAQALIDQGNLTAALAVLQDIAAESNPDVAERAEGLGLLGRIHKQRYVNAPRAPRAAESLRRAIDNYYRGYRLGTSNAGWHAVNAVAMVQRARRDGIDLEGLIDDGDLARKVLDLVGAKRESDLTPWDYAIKAEASLALGRHSDALAFCKRYLADPGEADAFEVNSTLRQMQEVWQLSADVEPGAKLIPLLQAEVLDRKGGKVEISAPQIQGARTRLEKTFGSEDTVTLAWYRTGLERCGLVARITNQFEAGGGTGFLVRAGDLLPRCEFPDELVLVTNAHVLEPLPSESGTLSPRQALVRFEAARGSIALQPVYRIREIVWSSPATKTDFDATIARLDPAPTGLAGCPIAPPGFVPQNGSRIYVIGHPLGGALSLSLYDNLLIDRDDRVLHYRTPTQPGSSGSPVFDRDWNLVGLHHAGDRNVPRLNGKPGLYEANEGIWIDAIRKPLSTFTPGSAKS